MKVSKVGVIARTDLKNAVEITKKVFHFLKAKKIEVFFDPITARAVKGPSLPIKNMDVDLIITIGGDGTILRTESQLAGKQIPIVGIHLGDIGFMTEIMPDEIPKALNRIVAGKYITEKRTKLSVKIAGERLPDALNEAAIMTAAPAKMLRLEISINNQVAEEIRADGVIVATPTGSTAYALSAGGPIVDPRVDAFIIAPICPFKLSARPLVIPADSTIKVRMLKPGKKAIVVVDGQHIREVNYDKEIIFTKSQSYAYFIKLESDFYQRVTKKLAG